MFCERRKVVCALPILFSSQVSHCCRTVYSQKSWALTAAFLPEVVCKALTPVLPRRGREEGPQNLILHSPSPHPIFFAK